jgi:hypothetical protein
MAPVAEVRGTAGQLMLRMRGGTRRPARTEKKILRIFNIFNI